MCEMNLLLVKRVHLMAASENNYTILATRPNASTDKGTNNSAY